MTADSGGGPAARLLALGRWQPAQVRVKMVPSTRHIDDEIERDIEETWQTAKQRPGVILFDGPMCRCEHWERRGEMLDLSISPTSYKIFMGTNLRADFVAQHGRRAAANPIGLSVAVETSDGFLLAGRRGPNVAYYPHRIHPFAGCLEPADACADTIDVFAGARRELHEELALNTADIATIELQGLAEDRALAQPELLFAVRSPRSRAQIESHLDAVEHIGLFACAANPRALADALRNATNFTPIAAASFVVFAHHAFGASLLD